jgi:hypothetical protein
MKKVAKNSETASPPSTQKTTAAGHLATYLNDHLAGSVTAIHLLSHMGTASPKVAQRRFARQLRMEVEQDQLVLQKLMDRLKIKQSGTRKATGWLAQKLTELKLKWDDSSSGNLSLLEHLELVALGIEGKRGLWQALEVVSRSVPGLSATDYHRLTDRALKQHARVESARLQAAQRAFAGRNP